MPVTISPLYPILDAAWLPAPNQHDGDAKRRFALEAVTGALAAAGVTMLQYRNKLEDDQQMLADAVCLRQSAPASLRIVLNDRVHLVEPSGCDGAHVGQGDLDPRQARALLGARRILGLSTHAEAQVQAADACPVDYIAVGPVYATGSKLNAEPVVGLEGLRRARRHTSKPLVAIGGITLARAAEVRADGADAVAVISALFPPGAASAGLPVAEPLRKLAEDFLHVFR